MTIRIRNWVVAAALAGSVTGLGVLGVAHASPQDGGSEAGAPYGHHGHGGLVHAALRLDSLSASQRQQIDALAAQEKSGRSNVAAARGQLLQSIATGLAAGSVDDKAVAPALQAVEAAMAADEPTERATLEKLHAILTPAQRVELVTRVESHLGSRGHGAAGEDAGAGRWGHGLGRELGLTDAQRAQIRANLQSAPPAVDPTLRSEEEATHRRVLEAFKGDRFVMNELAPATDPRIIAGRAGGMVRLAKASAPVLTADQRTAAAGKLRAMATHLAAH